MSGSFGRVELACRHAIRTVCSTVRLVAASDSVFRFAGAAVQWTGMGDDQRKQSGINWPAIMALAVIAFVIWLHYLGVSGF